jgi:hypothetical protein
MTDVSFAYRRIVIAGDCAGAAASALAQIIHMRCLLLPPQATPEPGPPPPAFSGLPGLLRFGSQRTTTADSEPFLIGTRPARGTTDASEALGDLGADAGDDLGDLKIGVLGFEASRADLGDPAWPSSAGAGTRRRNRTHGARGGQGGSGASSSRHGGGGDDAGGDSDSTVAGRIAQRARFLFGGSASPSIGGSEAGCAEGGTGAGALLAGEGSQGGLGYAEAAPSLPAAGTQQVWQPQEPAQDMQQQQQQQWQPEQRQQWQQRRRDSKRRSDAGGGADGGGGADNQRRAALEAQNHVSCEEIVVQFEAALADPKTRRDLARALSPQRAPLPVPAPTTGAPVARDPCHRPGRGAAEGEGGGAWAPLVQGESRPSHEWLLPACFGDPTPCDVLSWPPAANANPCGVSRFVTTHP